MKNIIVSLSKLGFPEERAKRILKNIKEKSAVIPAKLEIHAHEDCFCNCLFCINADWRSKKPRQALEKKNMKKEVLEKIIVDAKDLGIQSISFSGGGEPLLNPFVLPAIKKANSLGLATKLVTNGFLLDENAFDVLLDCNHLRISVNAASEETSRLVMNSSNGHTLQELIQKIRGLVEKKKASNSFLDIWLSYQIITKNFQEIGAFAKLSSELGVNGVLFEFPYCVKPELACSKKQVLEITKKIKQLKREHAGKLKIEFSEETTKYNKKRCKNFSRCFVPYFKLTISSNGSVFPCCQLADKGGETYSKYSLGNLAPNKGLKAVLYSKETIKKIANLNPKNCPDCIPTELKINYLLKDLKL